MKILTHGEHYNKKEKDMIELSKFSKACKEVLEILNNVEEKDLEKIPKDFIDDIKKNADKNYIPNIDINKKFEEQELLPETIDLLAYIYRKYWCDEKDKYEFDRVIQENENKKEKVFSSNNKNEDNTNLNQNDNFLINVNKNKTILQKIINYLKSIFNKI